MTNSTTIQFEHPKGNSSATDELCQHEIEVELGYEEGDSSYGADADGNRGISVPGYFYPAEDPPEKCSECEHCYSTEEKEEINKLMEKAADSYTESYEPPEPDYD